MAEQTYFDKARAVYLPGFIRSQGIVLKSQGRSHGSPTCPVCGTHDKHSNKVSVFQTSDGLWRWRCFACGDPAASAIDYAAHLWGTPEREAAYRLANMELPVDVAPLASHQEHMPLQRNDEAVSKVINLIRERGHTSVKEVLAYLKWRGIQEQLVEEGVHRGLIRMLPADPHLANRWLMDVVGEGLLKQAGFLKEGKKWPAISFRPLVFILGEHGAEFRLARDPKDDEIKSIRYGRLTMPFWWKGKDKKKVLMVEGAIDAISAVGIGWDCHIMGIPGCQSWRPEWFDMITKKYGMDVEFIRGLDSDEAGRKADEKIAEYLQRKGFNQSRYELPSGADWNILLKKAA